MIPKIIHYCWFGGNPLPKSAQKYIKSWKKYCPDYEIIEWNETNFDVNTNRYAKEAYEMKKWAFVTDYVRLYVLYHYGGVYMDTDVELLKNIDCFLKHQAFSGYEDETSIPTGIMGSEKGNEYIRFLLTDYDDRAFILDNGIIDNTPNVNTITKLTKEKYRIDLDGEYTEVQGKVVFYPKEFFCPKSCETGIINKTKNTYAIHHFAGSWMKNYKKSILRNRRKDRLDRIVHTPNRVLIKIMGNERYEWLKEFINK